MSVFGDFNIRPIREDLNEAITRFSTSSSTDVRDRLLVAREVQHCLWLKFQSKGDISRWWKSQGYTGYQICQHLWDQNHLANANINLKNPVDLTLEGRIPPFQVVAWAAEITSHFLEGRCNCTNRQGNELHSDQKLGWLGKVCQRWHRVTALADAETPYKRDPCMFLHKAIDGKVNLNHAFGESCFRDIYNSMLFGVITSPKGCPYGWITKTDKETGKTSGRLVELSVGEVQQNVPDETSESPITTAIDPRLGPLEQLIEEETQQEREQQLWNQIVPGLPLEEQLAMKLKFTGKTDLEIADELGIDGVDDNERINKVREILESAYKNCKRRFRRGEDKPPSL